MLNSGYFVCIKIFLLWRKLTVSRKGQLLNGSAINIYNTCALLSALAMLQQNWMNRSQFANALFYKVLFPWGHVKVLGPLLLFLDAILALHFFFYLQWTHVYFAHVACFMWTGNFARLTNVHILMFLYDMRVDCGVYAYRERNARSRGK